MDEEKITIEHSDDEVVVDTHTPPTLTEEHHSYIAPILGVLLVILVLILVGLYLWGAALTNEPVVIEPRVIENNEPETPRAEADAQILETVSPSDSLEAIEIDIESTNLDSLDAELDEIERELESGLQ